MDGRRKFRREGEEKRRDQLIAAALEIIAEQGPGTATVRAIAAQAGVTQGLIRHYFSTKEDLTREAYRQFMTAMNADNSAALENAQATPEARLAAFVAASLRPPVMTASRLRLWSGFIYHVRSDPEMAAIHEITYLAYREQLESLIAALPGTRDPHHLRRLAIACNGVVDGLWLEGSAYEQGFSEDELPHIGVEAVGSILSINLLQHMPAAMSKDREK